jgi:hypothetical protein
MDLDGILNEIKHMQRQIKRQQGDIRSLKAASIDAAAAELLLSRMQARLDGLCDQRDRLTPARRTYASGKAIYGTPSSRR